MLGGTVSRALAIVRPPGHHAECERAQGFCFFNNVAVAALAALQHPGERGGGKNVCVCVCVCVVHVCVCVCVCALQHPLTSLLAHRVHVGMAYSESFGVCACL